MKKTTIPVLILLALVACQGRPDLARNDGRSPRTLVTIRDRGEVRVGVSDFVPWVMKNRNGERIGFEIDVAKRLAGDMGARLVLVPVDTDVAALEAVRNGKADAAAASTPAPRFAALRHPDEIYLPLPSPLARTGEAFAIRQGDPDFLAFLNAWIRVRKADRFLERRAAYWFLGLDWERRL